MVGHDVRTGVPGTVVGHDVRAGVPGAVVGHDVRAGGPAEYNSPGMKELRQKGNGQGNIIFCLPHPFCIFQVNLLLWILLQVFFQPGLAFRFKLGQLYTGCHGDLFLLHRIQQPIGQTAQLNIPPNLFFSFAAVSGDLFHRSFFPGSQIGFFQFGVSSGLFPQAELFPLDQVGFIQYNIRFGVGVLFDDAGHIHTGQLAGVSAVATCQHHQAAVRHPAHQAGGKLPVAFDGLCQLPQFFRRISGIVLVIQGNQAIRVHHHDFFFRITYRMFPHGGRQGFFQRWDHFSSPPIPSNLCSISSATAR